MRPTDLVAPSDMQLVLHWALPLARFPTWRVQRVRTHCQGLGFLGGRVGYQCRSGDLPLPTYRHAKQQQDHLPLPTYLSPTVTCNRHVHM